MSLKIYKLYLAVVCAAFLLTGCASGLSSLKEQPLNNDVTQLSLKNAELSKEELKGWGAMDIHRDTVPGMSVDRAYDEIIKKVKGKSVIVGVLDSGTDVHHEDLAEVIWINKKEIAGNGKDDDNNGYVDDVYGWNFLGDAVHDNLEYTRILKVLNPVFEGKSEEEVQEEDREEFALYQRAKKEYDEEYREAEQNRTQYRQIRSNITEMVDLLKENTGTDNITTADLEEIDSEDTTVNIAGEMIGDLLMRTGADSTDEILEQLNEAYNYFNDKLEYHLNLEYDGRTLTGDNVNDISDTDYGNPDVTGPTEDKEDILHGTHVAGIIGAVRDNGIGMNGVAQNVELMVLRAVPDGDEYDKDIALGIRYAVDNGAKVINMSFGKYYSTHPEWVIEAMKYAAEHDVLLVKAAGNEGLDLDENRVYPNDQWPGQEEIVDNVIVVGALGPEYGENMIAPFSNYGKNSVDVFAPGVQIWATAPLDKYKFLQGTSMAAPGVSGIAALIRSYFPKLTAAQVKQVIMESGISSEVEVVLNGDNNNRKPFNEISKSGKMVNLYNALILASKM